MLVLPELIQLHCQNAVFVFQATYDLRKGRIFVTEHVSLHTVGEFNAVQMHNPVKVFPFCDLRLAEHALKAV